MCPFLSRLDALREEGGLRAIGSTQLPHYLADVSFDGILGQAQIKSDFFV